MIGLEIRPIPRGEFGNVIKKYANLNLLTPDKGKFDDRTKNTLPDQGFYNDYMQ